jgi:uncharacterized protein (TIGR00297 family)/Raf kinase inhibitor-like YbhB/YbcL family protein
MQILTGFLLAAVISIAAYFSRSLSVSGALAAAVLGTVVFGLGGLPWAVLLLAFFISSSLLSRLLKHRKIAVNEKFSKGSRRDLWQVSANGFVAGLAVLLHQVYPTSAWPWLAFAGALAAVNADTWATEIGVLGKQSPRLITTGRVVERGTSGAISLVGTLAAAAGAGLIAVLAAFFRPDMPSSPFPPGSIMVILVVTAAGLAGSLVDSLLGATVQAQFFCPDCRKETEKHPFHACGSPTTLLRGHTWLNNDVVNAACAVFGASLAAAAWLAFIHPADYSKGEMHMNVITVTSSAFQNGEAIPPEFSCDGDNRSPDLAWSDLPQGTKSLALIADDPDAPIGTFTHWVVYYMNTSLTSLPQGSASAGTRGRNSYGRLGYDGPCPPRGQTHRYYFTLYALDLPPDLAAGLDSAGLQRAMQGHILGQGQWMGTFKR